MSKEDYDRTVESAKQWRKFFSPSDSMNQNVVRDGDIVDFGKWFLNCVQRWTFKNGNKLNWSVNYLSAGWQEDKLLDEFYYFILWVAQNYVSSGNDKWFNPNDEQENGLAPTVTTAELFTTYSSSEKINLRKI